MSKSKDFLPKRQSALSSFGAQVLGVFASGDYTPDDFGLTDDHVANLDALVSEYDALLAKGARLRAALRANTKSLSGRKGTTARLSAYLRRCANIARASTAPNSALVRLNMKRKKVRGSRRNAPKEAPTFAVTHTIPGRVFFRFAELGSASPRARAANTIGVQIAVVDAANPLTGGEADHAPIKSVSHSPAWLDTKNWPDHARLYARWVTQRSEASSWSAPQLATVR